MKRIILSLAICCFSVSLYAQTKKQNNTAEIAVANQAEERPSVTSLSSSNSYAAFSDANISGGLLISDPTIRWFNSTYNLRHNNAVLGVPRLDNGIAHGRLIFRPTGSPTSGSMTGSGSVGTGSSLGSIGTNEAGMGVNGKNPYAGPGMYGSRVLSDLRDKEASNNSLSVKKD